MNEITDKRLSFYKLFSDKRYRVLIPIIQRDYAHGRDSAKEVRDTFLDVLFDYLEENKPNRDLDFVYGSLNEENGIINFIPLDGQQRLTTLFLLHWYLSQISENTEKKDEFYNALFKDNKSMFTYETRSSSSEFCDALVEHGIDFSKLTDSLSETIENSSWSYLSWKFDPTIQSMLTMLNAIHSKFAEKKEFFERLIDREKPIITFMLLNLNDFGLTDDLYIKMNSRGKPLTPFENFKAQFEQCLKTAEPDREFKLTFDSNKVSVKDYFAHNIDTKWADLFWNYRTRQNRSNTIIDNTFDDELMNFIRVIFTGQYAMTAEIQNAADPALEYLLGTKVARKEKNYSDIISYRKFKELIGLYDEDEKKKFENEKEKSSGEEKKEIEKKENSKKRTTAAYALFLIDAFDSLVNGNEKIKNFLPESYRFYFNENSVFENALKHHFSNNQERVCFHAYIRFLIENKNRNGIEQWMRVIHNLVQNTVIDSASDVVKAIRSVEKLLPHSGDILKYLREEDTKIDFFTEKQVREEKIKVHLLKTPDWKTQIELTEKHSYFSGQIGFILEFSKNGQDYDFDLFSDYSAKLTKLFGDEYTDNNRRQFQKALLTRGDYLPGSSWNKTFCTFNKSLEEKNENWRKVFNDSEKSVYLKQLLDNIDINNISDDLQKMIDAYPEDNNEWRSIFIKHTGVIEYCYNGRIGEQEKKGFVLSRSSSDNNWRKHAELYSYVLFLSRLSKLKNDTLSPFTKTWYCDAVNNPCAIVDNWYYKKHNYTIEIGHNNDGYSFGFFDRNGKRLSTEIREAIESFGFEKVKDSEFWEYKIDKKNSTFDEIVKKLIKFTGKLKKID
jgi:hypothetical protein